MPVRQENQENAYLGSPDRVESGLSAPSFLRNMGGWVSAEKLPIFDTEICIRDGTDASGFKSASTPDSCIRPHTSKRRAQEGTSDEDTLECTPTQTQIDRDAALSSGRVDGKDTSTRTSRRRTSGQKGSSDNVALSDSSG